MSATEMLSFSRLFQLISNDLRIQSKSILIIALTLTVFIALLPFHVTGDTGTYFFILYVCGFIVTSLSFNELHDKEKVQHYLTLPCANLERFLNKWLLTAIAIPIALLFLYYLFALLGVVLFYLAFHTHVAVFDIFDKDLWIEIGKYVILQSVVLFGAATFKRFRLVKTALVVGLLLIAFSLFSSIVGLFVFFPDYSQTGVMLSVSLTGAKFIFWILLAPIFWYITYLRLTEYELR